MIASEALVVVAVIALGVLGLLLPHRINPLRLRGSLDRGVRPGVSRAIPRVLGSGFVLLGVALLPTMVRIGESPATVVHPGGLPSSTPIASTAAPAVAVSPATGPAAAAERSSPSPAAVPPTTLAPERLPADPAIEPVVKAYAEEVLGVPVLAVNRLVEGQLRGLQVLVSDEACWSIRAASDGSDSLARKIHERFVALAKPEGTVLTIIGTPTEPFSGCATWTTHEHAE